MVHNSKDGSKTPNKSVKEPAAEVKYWGLSKFEWIIAVLTAAGVVIAILTGGIFWLQLGEMKTDQRAWVTVSLKPVQFPKDITQIKTTQVIAPIAINNVGKTAARNLVSNIVIEYEVNGQSPDFVYTNRVRTISTTGIMFPNSPQSVPVPFNEGKKGDTDTHPRFLTEGEFQDLIKGDGYMVVYGETTFSDIFGTKHWLHFCNFFVAPQATDVQVSAKGCTDYNDTDHD